MGVRFNQKGFVIRQPDGVVIQDSRLSAATGKPVRQARVLKAVPGSDVLFLSLHRNDELKGNQAKQLYDQARAWFDEQQSIDDAPPSDPDGDDAPPDGDDEDDV